jgi:CDP-2,3-bis-(O-geranylgeranyl)-sn-glycerol synthase
MVPAYAANNCATLLGGGTPMDLGRDFPDGRRILGNHKTIRGFTLGTLGGVAAGLMLAALAGPLSPYITGLAGPGTYMSPPLSVIVALSLGALAGDAVKSFAKRRLGIPSGERWPVADQLDFVLGAWALAFLASPEWFLDNFTLPVLAVILVITFPLQWLHNRIAVALGKKEHPW